MRLPEQTSPDHMVLEAAVALGRALRENGMVSTVDQELTFCRALAEIDIRNGFEVYWAASSAFLRSPDEKETFNRLFKRFWSGLSLVEGSPMAEHSESDPRMDAPQHGGESMPQFRQEGRSGSVLDGEASRATYDIPSAGTEEQDGQNEHDRKGVLAAYSPAEVLNEERAPLDYKSDELVAVRRLAEELRGAMPERRCRRLKPSRRGGRLDVRGTLRQALQTDGEALRPAYEAHSRTPRRLLLLCDVSGSMDRYSRALLAALQGVIGSGVKAETFVFATRLTRLTGTLSSHDTAKALEEARDSVNDWSGGTRIGRALEEFNNTWARRGLARGAIAIIVSDGWDKGDPEVLTAEIQRLQLQARRLVWLNPRPATVGGQPLAIGMRAALPYLDDFIPGHDPRAVAELGRLIRGLGSGKPVRRQRPLSSVAS